MANEVHVVKRSFEDVALIIANGPPTLQYEWAAIYEVDSPVLLDARGLTSLIRSTTMWSGILAARRRPVSNPLKVLTIFRPLGLSLTGLKTY